MRRVTQLLATTFLCPHGELKGRKGSSRYFKDTIYQSAPTAAYEA